MEENSALISQGARLARVAGLLGALNVECEASITTATMALRGYRQQVLA